MNLRNINGYFQKRIYNSLIQIVSAGRQAGGATPPQSFQLFVTGYVEFFDEDSDACNTIKWPLWGGLLGEYLNRDLRRRLNRNVVCLTYPLVSPRIRLLLTVFSPGRYRESGPPPKQPYP